jgi:hypothetical protein
MSLLLLLLIIITLRLAASATCGLLNANAQTSVKHIAVVAPDI